MRPPSKHGLDRKYKSWRKGKSSSENKSAATSGVKRPTNASLRNRLRGQKRLLGKLEQKKDGSGENDKAIDGVQHSIRQLERDIDAYEVREKEKKNAAKYHQVKFIERQKLTRLEKSVKRQLNGQNNQSDEQQQKLQQQLQSIAMDQLYVAFYPTNMKYFSLFTNGNQRVVDDNNKARNQRRRAWDAIREGLFKESKKGGANDDGEDDDDDEGAKATNGDGSTNNDGKKRMQLNNAKKWANLDVAKKALLSMPVDEYPNESHSSTMDLSSKAAKNKPQGKAANNETLATNNTKSTGSTKKEVPKSDGRFAMSKEVEGMFHESTTGDDYKEETKKPKQKKDGSDDSDSSEDSDSSSDSDDADPMKGFDGGKKKAEEPKTKSSSVKKVIQKKEDSSDSSSSAPSSSSSSSSSSSEDSSDSDSDSSSDSDSEVDMKPASTTEPTKQGSNNNQPEEDDDDGEDDFFATDAKVSAEDIFIQVQNTNEERKKRLHGARNNHFDKDDHGMRRSKPDKSKGFSGQNQSKKEYRAYQSREKRQKFG